MYKIIKHPFAERHKIFFSSDWHIFHNPSWDNPIWKMRGYESAEDSAEKIQAKINERVPEDAVLYYLGDLALNTTDEAVLNWLSGVKCRDIRKLFGNHSSNMYRLYKQEVKKQYGFDDLEVYPLKMGNITFLGNHQEIQIGKKIIVLNHFPLRIWRSQQHSSYMCSGHSHGNDKARRPEAEFQKALDCGWDIKNDVWSWDELEDVMSTKTVEILDHPRD